MPDDEMLTRLAQEATGMISAIGAARAGALDEEALWQTIEHHCQEMAALAGAPPEPADADDGAWMEDDDLFGDDEAHMPSPYILAKIKAH